MNEVDVHLCQHDADFRSELSEAEREEYVQDCERKQKVEMGDAEVAYEEALDLLGHFIDADISTDPPRVTHYCTCGDVALGWLGGYECSSCYDAH